MLGHTTCQSFEISNKSYAAPIALALEAKLYCHTSSILIFILTAIGKTHAL